jgi:hypothetical protein
MIPEQEDFYIHRAVSREATHEDWMAIDQIAAADPTVWERIAHSLRDQSQIQQLAASVASRAERIELPAAAPAPAAARRRGVSGQAGWLAAAAVALASVLFYSTLAPRSFADGGSASYETLMDLPGEFIDSTVSESGGGLDVLFVRRTLAKKRVRNLFEIQNDDLGRPVPVVARITKESVHL